MQPNSAHFCSKPPGFFCLIFCEREEIKKETQIVPMSSLALSLQESEHSSDFIPPLCSSSLASPLVHRSAWVGLLKDGNKTWPFTLHYAEKWVKKCLFF